MRLKRSKLSARQTQRVCEYFVAGTPARTAADLVGVNRNPAILFYHRVREVIATRIEDDNPIRGAVELDERYFGGVRKGRRGRGAAGKGPAFGILKRGGKVSTTMIPNAQALLVQHAISAFGFGLSDARGIRTSAPQPQHSVRGRSTETQARVKAAFLLLWKRCSGIGALLALSFTLACVSAVEGSVRCKTVRGQRQTVIAYWSWHLRESSPCQRSPKRVQLRAPIGNSI